jgi:hypothetical protein
VNLAQTQIVYAGNTWFDDEEHVAIAMDATVSIWNWRKNRKRATIFLMPDDNWAFVNHETQHWKGSQGADRYLRYVYHDSVRGTVALTSAYYRRETGWKNDPAKAGLDLKPWTGNSEATAKAQ